ncbi:hypothetical protein EV359DRAFT_69103 [Lentinula novae-zelandiae]|nr:hypothetical protein EV359DRAFT_69103 [Lentinula novae-zelandiae]
MININILLDIGICLSLAFVASVRFNRRRTEDSTHPTWSLIMVHLCGTQLGRLQPIPQYRLYYAEADLLNLNQDPDKTLPGCDVEVIPDYCILLHRAVFMPDVRLGAGRTLRNLLNSVGPLNLPYHSIRISTSFIPVLVELKRPVSRNCVDIQQFMSELVVFVVNAREQVERQASCLFSMPNFYRQSYVVAIAAVGEWWCLRVFWRSDFDEVFDAGDYLDNIGVGEQREAGIDGDRMTDLEDLNLVQPDQIDEMRRILVPLEESTQERQERQKRERKARWQKRQESKDARIQGYQDWRAFVDKTQSVMTGYSEQDMNQYLRLFSIWDHTWANWWATEDFVESGDPKGYQDLRQLKGWSKVMRLGSQASSYWLDQVQEDLSGWVHRNDIEDDR